MPGQSNDAHLSSQPREPRPLEWKDFLLKHKWMPSVQMVKKFGIAMYDINNLQRKPAVRVVLEPWRISLKQPSERLRAILTQAWKYYLTEIEHIDLDGPPRVWVPKLISLKNVSRGGTGFGFLASSKYLEIACLEQLTEFRSKGFTNIALAVYQFWPGRNRLLRNGVLPFMFLQTHRQALEHVDVKSMIEHVYLNFIAEEGAVSSPEALLEAKERLYVRHDEPGFLSTKMLERFGVSYNFYKDGGGLRMVLKKLAEKYAVELGYAPEENTRWSSAEFRKMFPERALDGCEYCGLRPIDLHHLLPREQYPTLAYEAENVVPLCVQAHGYITRGHWTSEEASAYQSCVKEWFKAKPSPGLRNIFQDIMGDIHTSIYGRSGE